MKTLEEIIEIKNEIESLVMNKPGVTGIDISRLDEEYRPNSEYIIRIFVNDESITLDRLNLQLQYKGVKIKLIKRQFYLQ